MAETWFIPCQGLGGGGLAYAGSRGRGCWGAALVARHSHHPREPQNAQAPDRKFCEEITSLGLCHVEVGWISGTTKGPIARGLADVEVSVYLRRLIYSPRTVSVVVQNGNFRVLDNAGSMVSEQSLWNLGGGQGFVFSRAEQRRRHCESKKSTGHGQHSLALASLEPQNFVA